MTVQLCSTREDLVAARIDGCLTAVVMTMGALHDGHAELIREARRRLGPKGLIIVTDFVNPTQFGAGEDFDRYPRTLDADIAVCAAAGADIVFAPSVDEVYGTSDLSRLGSQVQIVPGPLGNELEGAARPGHFRGVLTVVAKLMHLTSPDVALFGEKDYQQLTLITQMVRDLRFPIEIVPVETVREADGLAMSSRNRYLSDSERATAALIPKALSAVVAAGSRGEQNALEAGLAVLASDPSIDLDYLVIRSLDLLAAPASGPARVLIAARVGSTRLLDNMAMRLGGTQ
ncbi:MAG: pantoate--beta-alanine ligase [Candidatus Nanopelagicales bacterium]